MVLTPSRMIALGTPAPDFELPDVVSGRPLRFSAFSKGKPALVLFICRHCPYVQHIKRELAAVGKDYEKKSFAIIAISSNDAKNYPDDAPVRLKQMAAEEDFRFPFCHDESQAVAKAYSAACTPDFFLFDKNHRLAYRGQLDDSRPGNDKPLNGIDLREAIDAVLEERTPSSAQKPSIGCNIKWKPGNEPV